MLMKKEFDKLIHFSYLGKKGRVGEDKMTPKERQTAYFEYMNELHNQGIYIVPSKQLRDRFGSTKDEGTNSVLLLRRYGVLGMYVDQFNVGKERYRGFVYLKCNEHLIGPQMLEKYGRFSNELLERTLTIEESINKHKESDDPNIVELKNRLSFTITAEQYREYKRLRKQEVSRSVIAKKLGLPRWQLVIGADNGNRRIFKEVQNAN